jgi:spore coat polysaccharide biosynthesis protein SpsF (cytidylyltransferase family)
MDEIEKKIEEIKRQAPFSSIMIIKDVEPLTKGISKSTFKITATNGKLYKLRYCDSLRIAWRIQRNVKKFEHMFPKFHGREGRFVLFDWIEGPELPKQPPLEVFKEMGELYGEIHELNEEADFEKAERFFRKVVHYLLEHSIIEKDNIHNVKIDPKKDRLVIIDEEGIAHKVKGLGMARNFTLFFTEEQRTAFMEGYNTKHSGDYFSEEYEDFMKLYVLTRNVYTKARTDRPYLDLLKDLMDYLSEN